MTKARTAVVKQLATQALDAMHDESIEDLSPAEILSACFTLTRNVMEVVLEKGEPSMKYYNEMEMRTAIGNLYSLVLPPPERIN